MDQKITRRIVLGTIIGGLVAGPFVMRALRKRRIVPNGGTPTNMIVSLPSDLFRSASRNQFFDDWKKS